MTAPALPHPRLDALRDKLPIIGIALLLLVAIATLVMIARSSGVAAPPSSASIDPATGVAFPAAAPTETLAQLPATSGSKAVITSQLDAPTAQNRNGAIPIENAKRGLARPFAFRGSAADRQRAEECLALAGIAEAGLGDADQRAVMQVILNRVRHPAFAKSVCGVVFEGSLRNTGCQFTFTCDGSLARSYSEAGWSAVG